jgi:hypothetical protein
MAALRRGVVGVPGLPDQPGRRGHEDEGSGPGPLHVREVRAGGEERDREVRVDRGPPAVEPHARDGDVLLGPDAGVGDAAVEPAETVDRGAHEAVGRRLVAQVACSATPPVSRATASAASRLPW